MPENERRDSECKGRGEKKGNRKKKERREITCIKDERRGSKYRQREKDYMGMKE